MNTNQTMTVRVPAALMEAANHVHLLLGKAKALKTYQAANWQDSEGNLFALSSGKWENPQIDGVKNPDALGEIVAAGGVPEGCDITQAAQAQVAFELLEPDEEDNYPAPDPTKISAVQGDPKAAMAVLGVSPVEDDR